MSHFERSIRNLENSEPVVPHKVAILVCPPLTEDRFEKDSQRGLYFKIFQKKKEFILQQLKYLPTWEDYEKKIVLKVKMCLLRIKKHHHVDVLVDVTFEGFKTICENKKYDWIFLVAHYINSKTKQKNQIEFSDGGTTVSKFTQLVKQSFTKKQKSLILFICDTESLGKELYLKASSMNSIAAPNWKLPFVKGMEFLALWTSFFDGKNTLLDAYSKAIDQLIS